MSSWRPNIVFVFSDQQRYSALGANGNPVVRTPVLDGMAAEGMVCDNMFSNHPLCSPYRAILLTGQFGWRNGVIDNEYRPRRDIPTLPGTLREHGYGTAHVGTFHLGKGPYTEEGRYGIDYLAAVDVGRGYFDLAYCENEREAVTYPGWGPTVETDLAIRYLERHRADRPDDPFALFLSWRPPHWPYEQFPDSIERYDPAAVDLPANVPDALADHARRELADYYACCTGLDVEMGRLLAALDRLQIADDTIVCYTSDHGDHIRAHGYGKPNETWLHHTRRASKATPYEDSAHVPFVIRWPGNTSPGTRSDAFMGAIDIVPSLLGACGVPLPAGLQGRDLSPVWRGQPVPADPAARAGRQRVGVPDEHGQRLAQPLRLGGTLACRAHRALHVCPLVRQRAQPLAVRPPGRPAGDEQPGVFAGRAPGRAGDGGAPAPLDGGHRRSVRARRPRSARFRRGGPAMGGPGQVGAVGHELTRCPAGRRPNLPLHSPGPWRLTSPTP